MNKIKEFLGSEKVKVAVAVIAAVVMCYTPDHIDRIVETLLVMYGIDHLVLKKKDDTEDKTKEER